MSNGRVAEKTAQTLLCLRTFLFERSYTQAKHSMQIIISNVYTVSL
ncbi:hypothetical protein THOD03_360011 [Vibrio harveyi]|nr:hypothetical protein THOD03_360011 [Vibrio harveyi]